GKNVIKITEKAAVRLGEEGIAKGLKEVRAASKVEKAAVEATEEAAQVAAGGEERAGRGGGEGGRGGGGGGGEDGREEADGGGCESGEAGGEGSRESGREGRQEGREMDVLRSECRFADTEGIAGPCLPVGRPIYRRPLCQRSQ